MPEYAIILSLFLGVAVFLKWRFKVRLFSSPYRALAFFSIVLILGIIPDQYAIWRGLWAYGDQFLLGSRIGYMPLEEYLFMAILTFFVLVLYRIFEKH